MYNEFPDRRALKRWLRLEGRTHLYNCWLRGNDKGYKGKAYHNPFPAGRRHEQFRRGYEIGKADAEYESHNSV